MTTDEATLIPELPRLFFGREPEIAAITSLLFREPSNRADKILALNPEALKAAMKAAIDRIGLQELARRAKVHETAFRRWLGGSPIRQNNLDLVAAALEVPPTTLIKRIGTHSPSSVIVAIEGMGGVGKTTLAARLINDRAIQEAFPDFRFWASLGLNPNITNILSAWLHKIEPSMPLDSLTDTQKREAIKDRLRGRRFLVVVDDVWSFEAADKLWIGGGTLVTTREKNISSALVGPQENIVELGGLTQQESWDLLSKLAPDVCRDNRELILKLARTVEFLPLALEVMGRLLRDCYRQGVGLNELLTDLKAAPAELILDEQLPSGFTSPGISVHLLFGKSTDTLNKVDQQRFAELGPVAAEPASFSVDYLAALWGTRPDETVRSIKTLVDKALLQVVRPQGRFSMHSVLRAHALRLLPGFVAVPKTRKFP